MSDSKGADCFAVSNIRAVNGDNIGRIDIYGLIDAVSISNDGVTPNMLLDALNAIGVVDELEIHIFSQGGDVDAGFAIYSMLRQRNERITAYVEGIAASIATVIMCAADQIYMADSARLMIHNPYSSGFMTLGVDDARDLADEIELAAKTMAQIYAKRTGKTEREMMSLMHGKNGSGTWFTAEEAMAHGLADGYIPDAKRPGEIAACLRPAVFSWHGHIIDMSKFPNADKQTAGMINKNKDKGAKDMAGFLGFKKFKRQGTRRAEAALIDMVCPHCSADVLLNPETAEVMLAGTSESGGGEDEATTEARLTKSNIRAEVFTITCPSCNNEFVWDTDTDADGATAEPVTETTEVSIDNPDTAQELQARLKRAKAGSQKKAPRKKAGKTRAEIAETYCPNCSNVVVYDTASDSKSVDETGAEGYILLCSECGEEFIEPLEAPIPEAIPTDTPSPIAYRKGVLAERGRMLALDEMLLAAPGLSNMITAAKKSGASADTMSRNVFKAMANNPQAKGARQLAAFQRDAEESGINAVRLPQHYNKKAAFADAVSKRLEDR